MSEPRRSGGAVADVLWDGVLRAAVAEAAAYLDVLPTTELREVRDLKPAVRSAITDALVAAHDEALSQYVVDDHEKTLPLPNWKPQPGGLDVGVRLLGAEVPACAVELKLRDLRWTLWDFFKMADALLLEPLAASYLVVGATIADWEANVSDRCLEWFRPDGTFEGQSAELFQHNKEAWRDLLTGGSARPTSVPRVVSARLLARQPFVLDGKRAELRCIRVASHGRDELSFSADWCTGDWPDGVDPPNRYWSWRRRHWQLTKFLSDNGGRLPLEDVVKFASSLPFNVHPAEGVKEYGLVYRGEPLTLRPRGSRTLELTPAGATFLREWAHKFGP